MTEPEHCDHGWIHLCGGPHLPADENDTREMVPSPGPNDQPCQTVRCDVHCSCGAPDGIHHPECAVKESSSG